MELLFQQISLFQEMRSAEYILFKNMYFFDLGGLQARGPGPADTGPGTRARGPGPADPGSRGDPDLGTRARGPSTDEQATEDEQAAAGIPQ